MRAAVGDWLIVRSHTEGPNDRRAEIIGTGPEGAPPFTVRWAEDDREAVVFPGPDAQILPAARPSEQASAATDLLERVQSTIGGSMADRLGHRADLRSTRREIP